MFKSYRKRKELKMAMLEHDISQVKIANRLLSEARNVPADDEDLSQWIIHGQGGYMTDSEQQDMLEGAFKLYHSNPHARALVRSLVKYTLGKGPQIIPKPDSKRHIDAWDTFKKENNFNHREKEVATRLFRDGEVFLRKFRDENEKILRLRFIRANDIRNPTTEITNEKISFGIETDPDDIEKPLYYYQCNKDGSLKKRHPAENIIHLKINCDSDQKRGVSSLRVVAKRLKQYDDWLQDRIVLNKVRSAVALIKQVDSSSAKIRSIRDEQASSTLSDTRKRLKALQRGTVITAGKGVTYEMLSPNINASDVKDDGRAMLTSIAAALGMPEMILTSDYSNANFASTQVAQNPFLREIEDWQDFFTTFYKDLYALAIEMALGIEDAECDVEFPPIVLADLKELAEAFQILLQFKIISRKTFASKMGLNYEVEKGYIEEDDEFDKLMSPAPAAGAGGGAGGGGQGQPGGPTPFRMPMAPVNQFGALMDALMEKKWQDARDIVKEHFRYKDVFLEIVDAVEKQNEVQL